MPSNPVDEARRRIYDLCDEYGIVTRPLVEAIEAAIREQERSRYEGLLALADKWFDTGTSLMAGVPVETDEGLAFTAAHHLGRQGAGAAFIAASTELRAALTPSAPAEKEG